MPKFTTKRINIEAFQLDVDNLDYIEKWCNGQIKGIKLPLFNRVIDFQTEDGEYRAAIGEYIIKDKNGNFYTCPSYVFDKIFILKGES